MSTLNLRHTTYGLILVGIIGTLAFLLRASGNMFVDSPLAFLGFTGWIALPWLVFFGAAKMSPARGLWIGVLAIALGIIVAVTMYVYFSGTVVNPDPQSGIAFVALPLYQLVIAVVLWVVSFILRRRRA